MIESGCPCWAVAGKTGDAPHMKGDGIEMCEKADSRKARKPRKGYELHRHTMNIYSIAFNEIT